MAAKTSCWYFPSIAYSAHLPFFCAFCVSGTNMRRLISVGGLHLFVPVNWQGFLHHQPLRRFLQKIRFSFCPQKLPCCQAANNGVCLLFSYSHSLCSPHSKCTQGPKPSESSIITPHISYKECYLVEDEALRPPSPRSLSMVINRYGLCLRLLQAAVGPGRALWWDGRRPAAAPEVWSWSSWRGSVWTCRPPSRKQPAIDPSSSQPISPTHPTHLLSSQLLKV